MKSLQTQTPAKEQRLAWFREARFGLFIHWGIYALPAGFYRGQEIMAGTGEWIMNYARIPVAEYRELAGQFNPTKYDPVEWMALAKEAGMKYVVVTTKHHDGFALFDSKVSDWNVVQATPYGKDLIAPLAQAARAEGLKLGLYYSHDLDWSHPGGGGGMMELRADGKYVKAGGKWDKAQEGSFDDYLHNVSVPQVREILAAYRPDMIWWDYAQDITPERAEPFIALIQADAQLISNDRLGGGFRGDLGTPEQHIPESGPRGKDWEACMTMNDTWGFKINDHHWKSADEIVRMLVDVVCKGGNLLLNVGPTAEGTFPQEAIDRLKKVGAWLKVYGEAIYGAGPIPFGAELRAHRPAAQDKDGALVPVAHREWRCTAKPGKLYIHFFQWPAGAFTLSGVQGTVKRAFLLADPKHTPLPLTQAGDTVVIHLHAQAPDPIASVLCLEVTQGHQ